VLPGSSQRTLSGLTSLAMRRHLFDFDPDSFDMLRTSLPRLSALTFVVGDRLNISDPRPGYEWHEGDQWAADAVAALAHRSALTSLELYVPGGYGLEELAVLRLGRLSLEVMTEAREIEKLLCRIPASVDSDLVALTHLHLGNFDHGIRDLIRLPRNLHQVAPHLKVFSASSACMYTDYFSSQAQLQISCSGQEQVQPWRQLTELRLVDSRIKCHYGDATNVGTLGLGAMANLEVLEISNVGTYEDCDIQPVLRELRQLTRVRELSLNYLVGEYRIPRWAGPHVSVREILLPLQHSLTRLELGGSAAADLIEGPGLERLSRLRELRLCGNLEALASPLLQPHCYLLPLPASLRRLELACSRLHEELLAAVQAAANKQECALRVGRWL
jgi:hypothetical protein